MTRTARRAAAALAIAVGLVFVLYGMRAELAAWVLHRELAERGYPGARLRVVDVGWHRIALADVVLAPGIALGEVELDGGVSLLWRAPSAVAIRGANISRLPASRGGGGGGGGPPVRTVRISDSRIGDVATKISGTIDLAAREADLAADVAIAGKQLHDVELHVSGDRATVSARDGDRELAGELQLAGLAVRDGRATIELPRWSRGGVTADGVVIEAGLVREGNAVHVTGELSAERASVEGITIASPRTPFDVAIGDAHRDADALELLIAGVRVQVAPFVVTAPSAAGTVRGERLRARDVELRGAQLALPVEWRARSLAIGGVKLAGARGSVAADRSVAWSAGTLRAADATLRGAAGSVDREGRVTWRGRELRTGNVIVTRPRGTRGLDRSIRWRAAAIRWESISAPSPHGRVAPDGTITVLAARARWRDVELAGTELLARRREAAVARRSTGERRASDTITWRARTAERKGDRAERLAGQVELDRGRQLVRFERATFSRATLHRGRVELALDRQGDGRPRDRWLVARGTASAYGGSVAVARPAPVEELELDVRGIQLAELLRTLSPRVTGRGTLDGTLALRGGDLARLALAARGGGVVQVGDRAWVDRAAASIRAGDVAVPQRIGGALADFAYQHLSLSFTPELLRVAFDGRGRRIDQELHLVINVRGLDQL